MQPSYNGLRAEGMILSNQAAFWRRDAKEKLGGFNELLHYSFDYDWFLRLTNHVNHKVHSRFIMGALRFHEATKGSTQHLAFVKEYAELLAGREMPAWQRLLYKLWRYALLLGQGDFAYLFRGIKRRVMRTGTGHRLLND